MNLRKEIKQLKEEKNAVILAHYYQDPSIQDIADHVGNSLELAKKAQETSAKLIVFAGVHFMAETAKILNPSKKVLVPDLEAGCSLADDCKATDFKKFIDNYPEHLILASINCNAEIKAMSDLVCTSSNALEVVNSIPKHKKILFAPDEHLGNYLIKETGRDIILWDGSCLPHEAFYYNKILDLIMEYPYVQIIAHPDSDAEILKIAHFVGTTSKLLKYVKQMEYQEFIIAVEAEILQEMQRLVPHKKLIPAPIQDNISCACRACDFMKLNTLQKLYDCLKNEKPEVQLNHEIAYKAALPLQEMLSNH
ncbi:quinolinate synthase NadA [Psychroflexus sp. YR1-1]|uniref:Quinolinate synthase n=1 Tax=Psychroflexus aurantiacus TaxID=2709310 RepID=A0A6B3R2J0_9FLAO|nr:quinolinate synthase NadA [Psychroflexus aurantiacus]NEV93710.1 quinolinate synthase NadA [Psychroflexus aurantiacus]